MDRQGRIVWFGLTLGGLLSLLGLLVATAALPMAANVAGAAPADTDVLFEDDFDVARIGSVWTVIDDAPYADGPSRWVVRGGQLLQLSNIYRSEREYEFWQGTHIVAGDPAWTDYSFSFDMSADDDDGMGGIVRYQDKNNYYRFIMLKDPGNRGPFRRLEKFVAGERVVLAEDHQPFTPGQVYHVEMVAVGDRLEVWLDGQQLFVVNDAAFKAGKVGLMAYATNALVVDSVRVVRRTAAAAGQAAATAAEPVGGATTGNQTASANTPAVISEGKVISVALTNVGATSALVRWYTDRGTPQVEVTVAGTENPSDKRLISVTQQAIAARQVLVTGLLPETNYTVTVASGMSSMSRTFRTKSLNIARGPYLSLVTPSSITIAWESTDAVEGLVEYWPTDNPADRRTVAVQAQAMSASQHYKAVLEGLTPFTSYSYYVALRGGATEVKSQTYTLRTAPDNQQQTFVFSVYGDTQDRAQHQRVIQEMLKQPEVAFLLHQGDLINAPDPSEWANFFGPAQPMLGKTPFYPVYGNHDAQNLNFREYFELPNNEYWYSFDYGSVHVIGLDSTSDHSPGSPQYQWLVADLEAAKEMPWKVVYFHYPPYSPTVEDNTYSVRDYLNPLFEKYGVNIVFNGHSHVYDHYFVNGVHYVVTGGGGGWTITHETSKYNAPFHYTRVTVSPEKLVVEAVKVGGQLADRFEVTK